MNAPIPNKYDLENARQLAGFAAAAYESDWSDGADGSDVADGWGGSDGWDVAGRIVDGGTDTQVVLWKNAQDLIVAFRGTRSLRNFVTDLRARRVALAGGGPRQAEVHEGFQQALNSVWEALKSSVEKLLRAGGDAQQRVPAGGPGAPRLWITGHSLGGALAKLFAIRCQWGIAGVYTFGEPRGGNAAFRDYYEALLKSCTFRVVDGEDFITRIPWLLGMYRHCGTEVFYPSFGRDALLRVAGCAAAQPYQVSPPWWLKGCSDVFGTWREYHAGHRLALLADHHVSRYVEMLSAPNLNPNPNPLLPSESEGRDRIKITSKIRSGIPQP
jgi:triacylglycerol lipase